MADAMGKADPANLIAVFPEADVTGVSRKPGGAGGPKIRVSRYRLRDKYAANQNQNDQNNSTAHSSTSLHTSLQTIDGTRLLMTTYIIY
jgi:hypothetical protein